VTPRPLRTQPGSGRELVVRPPFPDRVPWPAVLVFTAVACALGWLAVLPLWLDGRGLSHPLAGVVLPLMMFTPGMAALIAVFLVQRPRPDRIAEYLGLWPLQPVRRTIWLSVAGIFGSAALVITAVFLAAALGLVQLDLVAFSGFAEFLDDASSVPVDLPVALVVLFQVLALPVTAIISGVFAFGEELGWRGWLLPSLRPLGTWPALLLTGAVWGLWHSPIILLGHNFAQPNLRGVALMVSGCVLLGVLIGWLRLRSGSVWPAVLAHGGFNASAGFLLLVAAADSPSDPVAVGPLGWVSWIVMVAVILLLVAAGAFRRQPALRR
jgi:membrane protease YdiL (CAAX protease family)